MYLKKGHLSKEFDLTWIKSHWRWAAFNLSAIFISVYVLSQGSTSWEDMDTFDSGLESGKWAIRFLLICLTMTPLNTYFGWKGGIKLRKSAGLWAFGFASLHIWLYIRKAKLEWLTYPMSDFLVLGITGMGILSVLAATSNRWSMKRLGKIWKQIHRRVYIAGMAVVIHSMLATEMSKKLMVRDPQAMSELKIYAAILCVLLVIRIPIVRELLMRIHALYYRRRQPNSPAKIPDDAKVFPQIYGRESGVSVKPTYVILNTPSNHLPSTRLHGLSESVIDSPSDEIQFEKEAEVQ